MRVKKTELDGVLLVELDAYRDHRGSYLETYNKEQYAEHGIGVEFIQDDISVSRKNVLRGIHGDADTSKLISCLYGEFYLVALNYDEKSRDFGRWQSFILSAENRCQVFVPPRYGNGHLVLSDTTIFYYKQTTYYNPAKQFTVKWNDPRFKIEWPVKDPILSERDRRGRFV